MPIARVENGAVAEVRHDLNIGDVPAHKAHAWKPIVFEGLGPNEQRIVEQDCVRIIRSPTAAEVIAERERRLALGFNYDFQDARGVHRIGTTESDMKGWDEVSKYAGALIDAGQLETQIAIATDTGACTVTPVEWRAVEIASAAFRQPIWARSFALMAMNPIPADFAHDSYWA
jgi:hypothetical protein